MTGGDRLTPPTAPMHPEDAAIGAMQEQLANAAALETRTFRSDEEMRLAPQRPIRSFEEDNTVQHLYAVIMAGSENFGVVQVIHPDGRPPSFMLSRLGIPNHSQQDEAEISGLLGRVPSPVDRAHMPKLRGTVSREAHFSVGVEGAEIVVRNYNPSNSTRVVTLRPEAEYTEVSPLNDGPFWAPEASAVLDALGPDPRGTKVL